LDFLGGREKLKKYLIKGLLNYSPSTNTAQAEIGVFGGSGFYSLFEGPVEEITMNTPYGQPSDKITIGEMAGHKVAFLPRHGAKHQYAPHTIPYLANLWAMKELGVKKIIAPAAAGSLTRHIKPGSFVICDQFVDRTSGRPSTFYNGPEILHVSTSDPYCPELRALAVHCARELNIEVHDRGTMVVVQGPRFSTRAESKWYQQAGFEVIGMTQYPEAALARELAMCYVNISLITDYDTGVDGIPPVDAQTVGKIFAENVDKVKMLIKKMISLMPQVPSCNCEHSLDNAKL
jgi:5'-methylthioadenosine phosphorylase